MAKTHDERRERRKLIADAASDGSTISEIARRFSVGVGTVEAACLEHGVRMKRDSRTQIRDSTYNIIAALFDASTTYQSIADRFGLTKQRVHQIHQKCVEAGVPVPARRQVETAL